MNELPKMEQAEELESPLDMAYRKLDEALSAVEWGGGLLRKIKEGGKNSLGAEKLDIEAVRSAVRESLEKLQAANDDVFAALEASQQ